MDCGNDQILDREGAAALLRVSPATIYKWVHERRIPFRKHGSRLAFSRVELEDWSARTGTDTHRDCQLLQSRVKRRRALAGLRSLKTEQSKAKAIPEEEDGQREH
jgi:excisionase family DNA binding protein